MIRRVIFLLLALICRQALPADHKSPQNPGPDSNPENNAVSALTPQQELQLAKQYNRERNYQLAADLLEHALLLNPELPGAVEEYEKALRGQQAQADQLLKQVVAAQPAPAWHVRQRLQLLGGYGNNLNRGPSSDLITLTLGDAAILARLNESQQPQAGYAAELGYLGQATGLAGPDSLLGFEFEYKKRQTQQAILASYQVFNAGAYYYARRPGGSFYNLGLSGHYLSYHHGPDLNALQFSGFYGPASIILGCQPRFGGDLLWRHQENFSLQDERYMGLAVKADCRYDRFDLALTARLGVDDAPKNRLGGDQLRGSLVVTQRWKDVDWLQGDSLTTEIDFQQQNDQEGYSELLENNARRHIRRWSFELDYQWPLTDAFTGLVQLRWLRQDSNLALFELDSSEAWLGLQWDW